MLPNLKTNFSAAGAEVDAGAEEAGADEEAGAEEAGAEVLPPQPDRAKLTIRTKTKRKHKDVFLFIGKPPPNYIIIIFFL